MTQLLISVKNIEEASMALHSGVDVIDLKEPSVGALGALADGVVEQVVRVVDGRALVSATVGEGHGNVDALVVSIKSRAALGVDIVKIAVSELFGQQDFFTEMLKLTDQGIKVVAVFFADNAIDLSLILKLQQAGFYGAMLDTQDKQFSLMDVQSTAYLNRFVSECEQSQLISGLAGSIQEQHMNALLQLAPTFIGLRGGVCENHIRASALSASKVYEIKSMLLNYNINFAGRLKTNGLALHS